MVRQHKWYDDPSLAFPKRQRCVRPDCNLTRIPYYAGKWVKYTFKRGNRVILYGTLGDRTPPCNPEGEREGEW